MAKIYNRALLISGENKKVGTPVVRIITLDKDNKVTRASGATTPSDADAGYAKGCIFVNTAGGVGTSVYINEGSATSADFNIVNGSGGAGVSTWDGLYALDQTLDINGVTLTFDRSSGNGDVITFTNSGGGSGDLIQITNGGTGKDIQGTNDTWSVSKLGDAVFNTVSFSGDADSAGFTLTIGDFTMSDGKMAITNQDNESTLLVTNNGLTSAAALELVGSGTHTGTGTSSFAQIRPTGLTTGTALTVIAAAATTSVAVVDIQTLGLTSGSAVRVASTTGVFTTGGKLVELDSAGAVAGNHLTATTSGAYTGTGMILVTAGAATTGVLVSIISTTGLTTGSLLRATTSTAGLIATNGAISLTASGAFTSTSGIAGGFVEVKANSTTAGTVFNILGTSLTTGVALSISNGTAATTSGSLLRVAAGGTGAVATSGIVSFTHTGIYTSTSAIDGGFVEVKANATTAGTIVNVVGSGLTTGVGLMLSNGTSAMTTGSMIRVNASGTGAIATNGIVSLTHAGIFTSTSATDGGFVEIKAAATTAGTLINVVAVGLITGIGMHISNGTAATTTGSLLRVTAGGTGAVATNGIVSFVHSGVYTSTTVGFLNVSASATTGGTVATVTGASVTDGVGLQISNAAITTGTHLSILGAAGASMFTVKVNGATVIAGSAIGTASLTQTAGDHTLTSGNLILTAGHIKNTPQAIASANTAISIVTLVTTISNAAATTHTLADGTVGQIKFITMTTYGDDAVITPANFVGTTITLNAAGDSWTGIFAGTEWRTLALGGTAAVA